MGEVISHRDIWNMNVMFKAQLHLLKTNPTVIETLLTNRQRPWSCEIFNCCQCTQLFQSLPTMHEVRGKEMCGSIHGGRRGGGG